MNAVIRPVRAEDDPLLSSIIREAFVSHHLDIPGTAYFDPELDHLSSFYASSPQKRSYLVLEADSEVKGGVGIAEFCAFSSCAEIQKLYLSPDMRGRGFGSLLLEEAETEARRLGYRKLYIETHTNFSTAVKMYEKKGFLRIPKPETVQHGTMNIFFIKSIQVENVQE